EPDQVDSLRFERLVDEGRRALAAGNPEAAARRLRQGLDLWRGPALADVAYEPFADREASRLEELRVAAMEDRVEADLARGLHSDLVAELDALVAAHPLRERLWGQRMVALYRCGRQAEALRAYRDLREALAEELGIDPSPALQRLEEAILQQREELAWTHAGGELGPTAAAAPELPGGVVSFLLTDIVSSTSLWEQFPDAMAQALARHDELIAELVDAGGGWLIKSKGEGDATLSVFVRASDAVATALQLQRAVQAEPWDGDIDLRVRVGVHTGEAQLRDGDYFGPTLNRAARIRALAGAGHVLLSQATAELVAERLPDGASLRALGQHTLRGLARPEHVFALAHPELDSSDLPYGDQAAQPARAADDTPRRHNLTVPLTAFVGRADARAELSALLAHDRLVTLTGPGGAGKTRLAEQVALDNLSRWPDGVWAVELAGLSDPRMVPSAVAAVVGVTEQSGRTITDGLIEALRARRMLLLLDNCEHVLDAAAELVEQLLPGCPQVDVLATSRQPLSAANEVTWGVPSLAVPPPLAAGDDVEKLLSSESVQLFVDRARLSDPRFDPSEAELRAVGDICRRLDGIPLAIELAAARVGTLTPRQIVERLDNAFELLTSGSRAALPRQQTLRALVDWSHDLLSAEEQALFRRLAVFAGPMRFDGVQAVADDDNARETLASLVDRSLVAQESDGVRFRLLETMRQYAYDKLRTAGEEAVYRSRHRDWVLALVEQAQPALEAGGDTGWHDRLEEELDNVRAALDWSLGEREGREPAARLASAANGFWVARHWSEGRQWLERSLAAAGALAPTIEAAARNSAANLAGLQGDFDAARRLLEGSVALGRELGDEALVREALHVLGNVTWDHGDFAGAVASYAEALEIARRLGDKRSVARALTNMGALDAWRGEYAAATALCEEALEIARQLGEGLIVRGALINLAYVLLRQGDRARPRRLLTEVLELARREGHTYDVMIAEGALGDVAIADNDLVGAHARLDEAVKLARQLGDKSALPELLNSLGRVLFDERDYAASAEAQHEALELATDTNQQLFRAQAVEGLAAVAVALGDASAGAHMLGAAESVRAEIGCPFPPFSSHVDRDQVVAAGQAALGAEQWEASRLLGQTLTL
ncbi:MAG: tetratricopeptide repeat protein, partial [Actinobacteria bacterium]|nr:tetratricopeptide repeat protein [Actinomycetota bacterium]